MNKAALTVVAALGAALAGCGGHGYGTATAPPAAQTPADFTAFVTQQVQSQPAFGTDPVATDTLTSNLGIDNAVAYGTLSFGSGDSLPAGTFQAFVACMQAGTSACQPTVSADLNSQLN